MVFNFKKTGLIILTIGVIIIAAFIIWPDAQLENQQKAENAEYDNSAIKNSLPTVPVTPVINDFFAEYRLERERIRGRQIELLREVLNSSAEQDARKEASLRLVQISEDMEKELQAEAMIKSKGYADCVVIIQQETILVVVESDNMRLDREEEIKEIVEKITGYGEENLCIIYRETQ